ncbi:hypothetical protein Lalb_Chr17g0336971 [Lupinus albus]|uniref:Uncharacterized protein n=1 Tax=Lupinus albus TaxID=3870 RepID=A0A6A4NYD2_LUPAL|nr:hypothetical protein Lalb_Chr17g0336971 [Lupinus albus]
MFTTSSLLLYHIFLLHYPLKMTFLMQHTGATITDTGTEPS